MNDENLVKIAYIQAESEKFEKIFILIKHFFSLTATVIIVYIIVDGVKPFLFSDPKNIKALTNLISKLNISNISGYILSAFFGGAYLLERKGKKRIIKKKAELQKSLKKNDSYRTSSELDDCENVSKGEKND